jgi:3-hydroxymyristoyl/3-hydroxydecanoyl-(acyl carrier protein) dehydratase
MTPSLLSIPACLSDLDATFLPVGQMRQITRVTHLADETIEGEVDLGAHHWVFPQHFPTDPIFPGTLIIEAAGQLVALWAWANEQQGRPRLVRASAEFRHPAGPGTEQIELRAVVKRRRNLNFGTVEVRAGTSHLATIEAVLAVLPSQ